MIVDKLIETYFGNNKKLCEEIEIETKRLICFFMNKIFKKDIPGYIDKYSNLSWEDLKTDEFQFKKKEGEKKDNNIGTFKFNPTGFDFTFRDTGGKKDIMVKSKDSKHNLDIDTIIGKKEQGNPSDKRISNIIDVNYINVCNQNRTWESKANEPCLDKDCEPNKVIYNIMGDSCTKENPCVFGYIGTENLIKLGYTPEFISRVPYPVRYGICNTWDDLNEKMNKAISFLIEEDVDDLNSKKKKSFPVLINEYAHRIKKNIKVLKTIKDYQPFKLENIDKVIDDKYADTIYIHIITLGNKIITLEPIIFIYIDEERKGIKKIITEKDNIKDVTLFKKQLKTINDWFITKFEEKICNKPRVSEKSKRNMIRNIMHFKIIYYLIDSTLSLRFKNFINRTEEGKKILKAIVKRIKNIMKSENFIPSEKNCKDIKKYYKQHELLSNPSNTKNVSKEKEHKPIINYNPLDIGKTLIEITINRNKYILGNIYKEDNSEWRNIYKIKGQLYGRINGSIESFDESIDIQVCSS